MILFIIVRNLLLVAAGGGLAWSMAGKFGSVPAMGMYAALFTVLVLLAAWLLKQTKMEETSWKNFFAGYTMPWGYSFCKTHSLAPAMIVSWSLWMVIGLGALLARHGNQMHQDATASASAVGRFWHILCYVYWAIDIGSILYISGVAAKHGSGSQARMRTIRVVAIICAYLIASVAIYAVGFVKLAVLVGGGVPTFVAVSYGVFLAVVLTVGRKARWN